VATTKLTPVLALNVDGFDDLLATDKAFAQRQLRAYLAIVRNQVTENRGRLFAAERDRFKAEFVSPVAAIVAATGIQEETRDLNQDQPNHRQMRFRMGIDIGPVSGEGKNLKGEAVTVATALSELGEGGDICFSKRAYAQVHERTDLEFEAFGEHALGGKTFEVFKGSESLEAYANVRSRGLGGGIGRRAIAGSIFGVLLLGILGAYLWQREQIESKEGQVAAVGGSRTPLFDKPVGGTPDSNAARAGVQDTAQNRERRDPAIVGAGNTAPTFSDGPPLPDRPSVAILPFNNVAKDPSLDHVARALADDIARALSRSGDRFVIATDSSFRYDGAPGSVAKVGLELGVRYVLLGVVQRSGDRVRLTVQMLEGGHEAPIWMKPFDRGLNDLQVTRTEIARDVAAGIGVPLSEEELNLARRRDTRRPEAYGEVLRGRLALMGSGREGLEAAIQAFKKAIEIDAQYAAAYEGLAIAELRLADSAPPFGAASDKAMEAAQQAVALDDTLAGAQSVLAMAHLNRRDYARAVATAAKAVDIDANYADGRAHLARVLVWTGAADDALIHAQAALRLNPRAPAWYHFSLGHAYFVKNDWDAAAAAFRRGLEVSPNWVPNRFYLAASYAQAGQKDKATFELARSDVRPYAAAVARGEGLPYQNPDHLSLWQDAMRKAGGS
jgi:adenylate cyclase